MALIAMRLNPDGHFSRHFQPDGAFLKNLL
jgi:hypothetical protein